MEIVVLKCEGIKYPSLLQGYQSMELKYIVEIIIIVVNNCSNIVESTMKIDYAWIAFFFYSDTNTRLKKFELFLMIIIVITKWFSNCSVTVFYVCVNDFVNHVFRCVVHIDIVLCLTINELPSSWIEAEWGRGRKRRWEDCWRKVNIFSVQKIILINLASSTKNSNS